MSLRNSLIIIISLFLIYVIWKHSKDASISNQEPIETGDNIILTVGSSGPLVKKLQEKLNSLIRQAVKSNVTLYCQYVENTEPRTVGMLTVDGILGVNTACALKSFTGKTSIYSSDIPKLQFNISEGSIIHDTIQWN